jgi:N-acetylglutamate synthase-like GNAT family acetyltransferase
MKARRATYDDLPQLIALWKLEKLDADDLEKRFTEFQVVEGEKGEVLGAIGLQMWTHQGVLHSESIARADLGDKLRQMLWERVQVVARNHSLDRIWTVLRMNIWKSAGFVPATAEQLEKFPDGFGDRTLPWQLFLLRGEKGSADVIEKQFAMLRALQMREREQLQTRVATFKKIAIGVTAVVAALVIVWAVVVFKYGPRFMNR